MITFDEKALKDRLLQEGQPDYQIAEMIKNIGRIDERLNTALNAWIADGTIIDFEVEGVTLQKIMEKTAANFYSALFAMSVFLGNPEKARRFLETPFFLKGQEKTRTE